VADISMGSGHFPIATVDRIERRFSSYLAKRPLPGVVNELSRLRQAAIDGIENAGGSIEGIEIENIQLLRRQIARRCIYGVDVNNIAVQLARLSLWIHTFVPGLPLSFLDHNVVCGNSLVGIATFDEVSELLTRGGARPLFSHSADALIGSAEAAVKRLAQLSDADAEQIKKAREAFEEQRAAVAETERMFDILTAARIPEAEISLSPDDFDSENELFIQGTHRRALVALEELRPFHFPVAFPEVFLRERSGFDVIVGNPPWEKTQVEEHAFWGRYEPGLRGLKQAERERVQVNYRRTRPDLVKQYEQEVSEAESFRKLLMGGQFPGMGSSHPDLYKAFCWRFLQLSSAADGRVGIVLPRSALCASGSSEFRQSLFQVGSVEDLIYVINTGGWVFDDAEPRYTIALTCLVKQQIGRKKVVRLRGPYSSLDRFKRGVQSPPIEFPIDEVLEWTDTAALPLLPGEPSAEVFAQLRKSPRLDLDREDEWRARPYQELNATKGKEFMSFSDSNTETSWPVYKAEAFDIWEPDKGDYYGWAEPEAVLDELHSRRLRARKNRNSPFFEFTDVAWFRNSATLPCMQPRIAFHDVARNTDTRTVKVALVPPKVFLTHLVPTFLWPRGDELDEAFLLGVMSSIPLDWYARRFVELHLSFNVLNPFPVPRPPRESLFWRRTVELSGRLACSDRRFARWAKVVGVECGKLDDREKHDMICELDAVVAHLYRLTEPQLVHIFETFHEGWDYQSRLDAVLKHFRTWAAAEGRS
jgi:hypothetical protein